MTQTDAWGEVLGRIVQGFTHDLNNRLLVLVGVRDLIEPDGADAGLLELFDRELEGLETENRLLRRLVVPDAETEACSPRELLDDARALHRRHRGLQSVEVEWTVPPDLPAIEVVPSALVRALLLVLAAAGEEALRRGEEEGTVVAEGGADGVVIAVRPGPEAGNDRLRAAAAVLEPMGARLTADDDGVRLLVPAVAGQGE